MDTKIHDEPSATEAIEGSVAVMGPDGVSILMTPEAAVETSDRMLDSAMTAQGQKAETRRKREERRAFGFEDRPEERPRAKA